MASLSTVAEEIATDVLIAIAGNMLGGLRFVTLAHIGQARAEGA